MCYVQRPYRIGPAGERAQKNEAPENILVILMYRPVNLERFWHIPLTNKATAPNIDSPKIKQTRALYNQPLKQQCCVARAYNVGHHPHCKPSQERKNVQRRLSYVISNPAHTHDTLTPTTQARFLDSVRSKLCR